MTEPAPDAPLEDELAGEPVPAWVPEDDDPLRFVGDEADAPEDTGLPADGTVHPPPSPTALPDPAVGPWRLAGSLIELRAEQNALWPHRDRASDGTIGDAEHAARTSDHNPWVKDTHGVGVVRAADTDVDGFPAAAFAELVRRLGAAGDARLNPAGYVIYNRRIASAQHGWVWRAYTGVNPHEVEVHVSVTTAAGGYDLRTSWGLAQLLGPAHQHATPTISRRDVGHPQAIADLQGHLNAWRRGRRLSVHAGQPGLWDEWTEVALRTFQKAYGLRPDGVCGEQTWRVVHAITKGAKA